MSSADQAVKATRRDWIGLGVIALPCLLYSMDLTVLFLAVPQLLAAARDAFLTGFELAAAICAAIALIMVGVVIALLRNVRTS